MKKTKKLIALILCLTLALCAVVVPATAEEETNIGVVISSAKAVAFKDGDPQTVTRLELQIEAKKGEDEQPLAVFDKMNKVDEIPIYEAVYCEIYLAYKSSFSLTEKEIFSNAKIGAAKPVSYNDGKLILDIFSKSGEAGAKMIDIQVDVDGGESFSGFFFDFPAGLFEETASGTKSEGNLTFAAVDGLTVETLKLPSLIKGIINNILNDNIAGVIGTAVAVLPFAFVVIPVVAAIFSVRANKVYKIYGINAGKVIFDVLRALPNILINEFFS